MPKHVAGCIQTELSNKIIMVGDHLKKSKHFWKTWITPENTRFQRRNEAVSILKTHKNFSSQREVPISSCLFKTLPVQIIYFEHVLARQWTRFPLRAIITVPCAGQTGIQFPIEAGIFAYATNFIPLVIVTQLIFIRYRSPFLFTYNLSFGMPV